MEGTSGLFWIKGDPGAGKSVLMKHSVKMMRERSLDDIVVSFFFHGQGTPLQKTLLGLYRALLASMLEHFPEDLTHLAVKFAEKEKRYGRFSERRWEWTEKELQALLSSVLAKGTQCQPVVVFIDALDECGEAPAKSLLAYFKDLTSQVESGDARFRICLSSRHYPILSLDTIPSVQVEQRNNQDIRRYIHMKLRDIRPKSKREQIKTEILSKSHGGFQWAILVTRTVLDRNLIGIKAEKLLEELNSCPQTLGEIYEAIFNSVPETDQYQMAKIFQWVQFAERPLSAQELRDALATDQDMSHRSISDLHAYEGWSNSLDDFERHVKHISRGLIRFQSREMWEQYEPNGEDSDREAQLIHQSVADFLTDQFSNSVRNHVPTIQSSAGPSHFQISRSCLRYMTLEEILENAHLPRGTLSSMFPLAPYAVRFLFAHIQKVEEEGITQSDLLSVLRWRPGSELMRKLARLWRTLDPDSVHTPLGWPFVKATALHVLVAFGSMSAVNVFFESGCDETDSRDADRNTPLMLAIREGHQNIALALLDRYVEREGRHEQHDPDSECGATQLSVARVADINAQNEDGDTALNIALDQQMGEVILKLIEAGADLKYLGRPIALVAHAVSSRNTKLLSILIENELNLDGAVFFALKDQLSQRDPALEGIVSQLLCAGANTARSSELNDLPQPDDFEYYEEYKGADDGRFDSDALALATRQDLAGVVELLLANDAPAALQNDLGQCPLLIATSYGHAEIVQMLLLKAPSSVETVDGDGDTALSIAIFMGELEIAKLLLQEGSFSSIPLLEKCFLDAARSGATDIVGIVLQRELLDLEFAHAEGRLPLCLAAQNGHAAVVQLLLNTGKVDPDLRDNDGFTALSWAAASGHEAVVKLLLDTNGVNFGAKSTNGNTPLSLAARSGHETVVKLLLDTNGVEFNVKNANGNTPLLLAVESGQEAVVKLLLNTNGVDFNAKNGYGNTPLLVAVQSGQEAVVKLLLDTNGVDFNMKSSNGNTPLSWAAENGHRGVVKLLLNTGKVDSNHKNEHARTALSLAAENGHAAVVQQLLRADKVDPDSTDNDGLTALSWAIVRRHEAVVKLLLD
jgi:ankyrin repeat protein